MQSIVFPCEQSRVKEYNSVVGSMYSLLSSKGFTTYIIKEPSVDSNNPQHVVISSILVTTAEITKDLCNEYVAKYPGMVCYIGRDQKLKIRNTNECKKPYIIRVIHPDKIKNYQFSHYSGAVTNDAVLTVEYGETLTKETLSLIQVYHNLGIQIRCMNGREPMFTVDGDWDFETYTVDTLMTYPNIVNEKVELVDESEDESVEQLPLKRLLLTGLNICDNRLCTENMRKITRDSIISAILEDKYPNSGIVTTSEVLDKKVLHIESKILSTLKTCNEYKDTILLLHDETVVEEEIKLISYNALDECLKEYF